MLSRGGGGPKSLIETTLSTNKKQLTPDPDQTIEILMTELDPKVMALFNKIECADAKEATEVSIHRYIPTWHNRKSPNSRFFSAEIWYL
jgi:Adenosylmethionine decarboxylase